MLEMIGATCILLAMAIPISVIGELWLTKYGIFKPDPELREVGVINGLATTIWVAGWGTYFLWPG